MAICGFADAFRKCLRFKREGQRIAASNFGERGAKVKSKKYGCVTRNRDSAIAVFYFAQSRQRDARTLSKDVLGEATLQTGHFHVVTKR